MEKSSFTVTALFLQVYEAESGEIKEDNVTAFVTKYFEKKLEAKPLSR